MFLFHHNTIIIPTSDVYRPWQLLLNKKACWMVVFMLMTVIILTAIASHTHCYFKLPFKKQGEFFVSPECNLTWKELLACGTSMRFTVKSLLVQFKKNNRLCLLDWQLPTVLHERLHLMDHLVLGAYNLLHPQNTIFIQTVIHSCCRFFIRDEEHLSSPVRAPSGIPWVPPNSTYCQAPFYNCRV